MNSSNEVIFIFISAKNDFVALMINSMPMQRHFGFRFSHGSIFDNRIVRWRHARRLEGIKEFSSKLNCRILVDNGGSELWSFGHEWYPRLLSTVCIIALTQKISLSHKHLRFSSMWRKSCFRVPWQVKQSVHMRDHAVGSVPEEYHFQFPVATERTVLLTRLQKDMPTC